MSRLSVAVGLTACLLCAPAWAETIATFADPAPDGDPPLFVVTATTVDASWSGDGLTLITPQGGGPYPDVTFAMTQLTRIDPVTTSGGTIIFWDNGGSLLFQIDFGAGSLYEPFGFGGSDFLGHNVTFSGPAAPPQFPADQVFAFSFANPEPVPGGMSYTASFTSSANVPEPASLLLLVGGLGLVRRR